MFSASVYEDIRFRFRGLGLRVCFILCRLTCVLSPFCSFLKTARKCDVYEAALSSENR